MIRSLDCSVVLCIFLLLVVVSGLGARDIMGVLALGGVICELGSEYSIVVSSR